MNGGAFSSSTISPKLLALFLAFLLAGCRSNEAHIHLAAQALRPCGSDAVTALSIDATTPPADSYIIRWEGSGQPPPEFNFRAPVPGFTFTADGVTALAPAQFKLRPNTAYQIRHTTQGDAGPAILRIETDGTGAIRSSSKTSCK